MTSSDCERVPATVLIQVLTPSMKVRISDVRMMTDRLTISSYNICRFRYVLPKGLKIAVLPKFYWM